MAIVTAAYRNVAPKPDPGGARPPGMWGKIILRSRIAPEGASMAMSLSNGRYLLQWSDIYILPWLPTTLARLQQTIFRFVLFDASLYSRLGASLGFFITPQRICGYGERLMFKIFFKVVTPVTHRKSISTCRALKIQYKKIQY